MPRKFVAAGKKDAFEAAVAYAYGNSKVLTHSFKKFDAAVEKGKTEKGTRTYMRAFADEYKKAIPSLKHQSIALHAKVVRVMKKW